MSRYTVQLGSVVEQFLDDSGLPHDEGNWPSIYGRMGLSDFPIFEEAHRHVLNDKIIRAYWFREIGFETFGQFRWHLRRRMHEIMPYWNEMYRSVSLITDPLTTRGIERREKWDRGETTTNTGSSSSDQSATSTTSDRNVFQDTPMNGLDTGAVQNMDYATNVTFDDGSTESKGETSSTTSSKYDGTFAGTRVETEDGYDRPQAELLEIYRRNLINIDLEIVDSLNVLFMGLW